MAENLLLCPFCGANAFLFKSAGYWASCTNEACECEGPGRADPQDATAIWNRRALPNDVLALVIAAREFWDIHNELSDESHALDKALEAFGERVPYENEPHDAASTSGQEPDHPAQQGGSDADRKPISDEARHLPDLHYAAQIFCNSSAEVSSLEVPFPKSAEWRPPHEEDRPEGYRCLALVELEWVKDISGKACWSRPDEHSFLAIEPGAPGVYGFRPAPTSTTGERKMPDHSDVVSVVSPTKTMSPTNGFRWLLRGRERVLQQCFIAIETREQDWIDVPTFGGNSEPSSYDMFDGDLEEWASA